MIDQRRIAASILFACLSFFLFPAGHVWGDWPKWRGPDGNGTASETDWNPAALESGPDILWQASVGAGYSSLAISDGRVYTLGNKNGEDTVYCLDMLSGKVLWEYSYDCSSGQYPGPKATPAVDGNLVYTSSREGHLYCFNALSGDVVWFKHLVDDYRVRPPQWRFAGSPVVHGDLVILNAGPSGLALDKATGEKIWGSGRNGAGYATPVMYDHGDSPAVAIFSSNSISGVEVENGDVLWSYPWHTGSDVNASDPVIFRQYAFVASAYSKGSGKIDFSGRPALVWESRYFQTHFSSFVLIEGYLYGNDGDARRPSSGKYRCVDFETGREMWSETLGFGSLIAVGEYLIMLNSLGTIVIAEATPDEFREVSRASLPRNQFWSPPAYSDQRLFVRNLRGDVFCIGLR